MRATSRSFRVAFTGILLIAAPLSAQAQSDNLSPDEHYAAAYALYDAGLYGEAARAFEEFRISFPDHARAPDALFHGGQSELAAGRAARAAQLLGLFRRRYPMHPLAPRARLALGEFHFSQGEYEQAIDALQAALDERPPDEEAARAELVIGQANLRLGRLDTALGNFRHIVDEYPRTSVAPKALYAIGYTEMERGNHTEAADAFHRITIRYRRTPEDRMIGLTYAESLWLSGQLGGVVPEVDRRLEDVPVGDTEGGFPVSPVVAAERQAFRDRGNLIAGEALLLMGDHEEAENRFRRISSEGEYAHHAAFSLGYIAHHRGEHQEAAALFEYAGQSDVPELASEAFYMAGLAYRASGQLDSAIRSFSNAETVDPGGNFSDVAAFEHGMLLYTTRQWDEATRTFDRMLQQYPTSVHAGQAARMLGETYAALGDFQRAEQAGRRANELGTASPELAGEVEFQRAYQDVRQRNYSEAETALSQLYQQNPRGDRAGEALFWSAESAFQVGQQGSRDALQRAQDRFTTFLTNFPDHRQRDAARYALAWTYFKQGNYAQAADAFERFLAAYQPSDELIPYTADARLRLGDSYFALRRWNDAATAYRRVSGAGADYARFQIGQALANAGRSEEAVAAYQQLISEFPNSSLRAPARYSIGDLRFRQGRYDEAIRIFEEVISQFPNSPVAARAQFAIGDARYNQGQLADAATAYRAILDRYPNSQLVPDALSALEMTLGALGRESEISGIVRQFAERNPGVGAVDELYFRQAESRYQRGDAAGSIPELQNILRQTRDPELRPPTLLYLGRAYADTGNITEAERQFQQLLRQYPNSPLTAEASLRLGRIYLDQRRLNDALPLFRHAVSGADSPGTATDARLGEAATLIGLNRHGEARSLLDAVIRDAPSRAAAARANTLLAEVHLATGRPAEAYVLYGQVAQEYDGAVGAEAAARLATSQLANREFQGVISSAERLRVEERFAGYPEHIADVLLSVARAHRSLGQQGRAEEVYDRLIRSYPDTRAGQTAGRERDS